MQLTAGTNFIKLMLSGLTRTMEMKICNRFFFPLICISICFSACHSGPEKPSFTDTPTSGEVTIVCDESYQPLISVESDTFHSIYQYATVHVKYLPEGEAFKELVNNDSIRVIISSRKLNKSEEEYFR